MAKDFSWEHQAHEYVALYESMKSNRAI
jgi:glycogen synthase